MTNSRADLLETRLKGLTDAILQEAAGNPVFAANIDAALAIRTQEPIDQNTIEKLRKETILSTAKQSPSHPMLKNASGSFDPLELHLEAALMNGREIEARAFLSKLDRGELEQVVWAQRLPGARELQRTIAEAVDSSSAVDAIVGSATKKARSRFMAAG